MAFSGKPTCKLLLLITLCFIILLTAFQHLKLSHKTLLTANNSQYFTTFLDSSNNSTIASYLRKLTLHPHLAGTQLSLSTALYVYSVFNSLNLKTHITNSTALLSYPIHSSLSIHFPNGSFISLRLSEPGKKDDVVMPYHAYSPSGSVYERVVFLNYGREKDYVELVGNGVEVKGCVGVVRRGGDLSRYDVVKNAEKRGVVAVVMYTEGEFKDGVERGTVMKGVGDPLSPGWAGGEKLGLDDPRVVERFPGVPSLPVSENVAKDILGALEGEGGIMLNFTYEGEKKMATIYNVFAEIKGHEEPDRIVMLGNHRDAWTYGAVDPNSGTSVLLDIARRYALLMRSGWKPRRTIMLCSWDAEEFGMIGSTEWVEQNLKDIGSKAVAYLNVDCASQGPGFFVSATPQLDDLLFEVMKKVKDPDLDNEFLFPRSTANNEAANTKIGRLSRVDSDFAPFLQHAGVASVDLYFGKDFPVYHTAFDSYNWMAKYGDPLFKRHVAVAGVWGLVALHLADDPVLPFNYLSYATELLEYRNVLISMVGQSISLHTIDAAIHDFTTAANEAQEEAKKLREDQTLGDSSALRRRMLNDRLMLAERGFLDSEGISGRQWFKHLIYGPTDDPEANISFFPGIADALVSRTVKNEGKEVIRHEICRVTRAILRVARTLRGELT